MRAPIVIGLTPTAPATTNLVVAQGFADPSSVDALVQSTQVGAAVQNVTNATLAVPANTVAADATVNSQTAAQTLVSGEDNLAVAVLSTTTDNTTSTATVEDSTAGVRVTADATIDGADTSITVNDNALAATARANDGSSALNAEGAESGIAGNSAGSPDRDSTYPTGTLTYSGDLLATGVQQLDQQSNVSASVEDGFVGLTDGEFDATVAGIDGGVSVNNNGASARADGNRLALSLNETLSGTDVDSTVYGLQTASDTEVSAEVAETDVGLNTKVFDASSVTVDANSVQAVAAGNRATATLAARPDNSSDSALADVEQFVRAKDNAVSIDADVEETRIGRISTSAGLPTSTIADNRLTALAIGNEQAATAALGAGVQAGSATVEGNQTLVLDGNRLDISASLDSSTIGTLAGLEVESRTTVNGNTAVGQVIGNNASQSSAAFAGSREADLRLDLQQRADGDDAETLRLSSEVDSLNIGAGAPDMRDLRLTVDQNQVASLSTLNRAAQTVGLQSGNSSSAGTLRVVADQRADSVESRAEVSDLRVGLLGNSSISESTLAATDITVTGNRVDAQAELNRAQQTLEGFSGNIGGDTAPSVTQEVNAAAGGVSRVDAVLDNTGIGIYGSSGTIAVDNGRFDLTVNGNQLRAQAQANLAQTNLGPVSGTVNLGMASFTASFSQTAADSGVFAQTFDTGLGIAEAMAPSLFDVLTNTVSITVADNSLQALARQNSASFTQGGVSGELRTGELGGNIAQTVSGASITRAENSGVFAGVTPAVGVTAAFGIARERSVLTVTGNSVRADAADNLATAAGAGVNGRIGSGARYGSTITQSSSGSQIEAVNTLIDLGAAEQNDTNLGNTAGSETITVADNAVAAVASGNVADTALGGVSGEIASGGTAGVQVTQTLDSKVTATTSQVRAGITDAQLGNVNATGRTALTVTGNGVVTAAAGNDSRVDLGRSAARIDGSLSAITTQTVNDHASLAASADALRIGAAKIGELGTAGAVNISVDGNAVRTSATANNSRVDGSVSGSLAGSVTLDATQTLNGSAAGITAITGTELNPNLIGVQAETVGAQASVSVDDNLVSSAVAANRVLNNLDGAAFSSASGSIELAAVQTVNGANVATGDLRSEVAYTTVGVTSASATLLPGAAVTGNQLVADTVGNQSARVLNDLSGNFAPTGVAVEMDDTQSVSNANLVASVNNSRIGGELFSNAAIPTSLAVNGNAVLAQSIANSASQTVSLNGVNTRGGQLTSLNAGQSLVNSSVRAEVVNLSVGLGTGGVGMAPGTFSGAAVTSGNAVNANAIGNQSSLIRTGR